MVLDKNYKDLIKLKTFKERFIYLQRSMPIGEFTFGSHRYLCQEFYMSKEWHDTRREIILRDKACDLGIDGFEIYKDIIIHHINPISIDDIVNRSELLFRPRQSYLYI